MAVPQTSGREAIVATYMVGMVGILAVLTMGLFVSPEKMPGFFQMTDPVFHLSIATHIAWLLLFSFLFVFFRVPALLFMPPVSRLADWASRFSFVCGYLPLVMNALYFLSNLALYFYEDMVLNPGFGVVVIISSGLLLLAWYQQKHPKRYKTLMDSCRRRIGPFVKWLRDACIWIRTIDH